MQLFTRRPTLNQSKNEGGFPQQLLEPLIISTVSYTEAISSFVSEHSRALKPIIQPALKCSVTLREKRVKVKANNTATTFSAKTQTHIHAESVGFDEWIGEGRRCVLLHLPPHPPHTHTPSQARRMPCPAQTSLVSINPSSVRRCTITENITF